MRRGRELGIDGRVEIAFLDTAANQVDQRLASLGGVAVVKLAHARIALGAFDHRRDAAREGRIDDHLGDVSEQELDRLARRAIAEVGDHLLVEGLERVGDQVELVAPVPVDRRLPHAGTGSDRFDRDAPVADLGQLGNGRLEDHRPRALDPAGRSGRRQGPRDELSMQR